MTIPQSAAKLHRAPIGRRPGADPASTWVRQTDAPEIPAKASIYTARLTVDVTPTLRGQYVRVDDARTNSAAPG